jgi:hypothetical protein
MRNVFRWASIIWLPASIVLAQEAAVQVVFAPEYKTRAAAAVNGNSVNEAREIPAPGGAIGMRLSEESMAGTVATIGSDGRLRFECAGKQESVRKIKAAAAAGPSRKGTAHEK